MLNAGKDEVSVLEALEVSESSYERWRKQYGGMKGLPHHQIDVDNLEVHRRRRQDDCRTRHSNSITYSGLAYGPAQLQLFFRFSNLGSRHLQIDLSNGFTQILSRNESTELVRKRVNSQ